MSVATVAATVDLANVPPRVRLDVSDTGSPAFTTVTVTRLNPDGTTVPVRTTDGNPLPMSGGVGLVYDYEMPFGAPVTYSTQETPANVTTPVTVDPGVAWLIHPGVPALSLPIQMGRGSFTKRTQTVTQGRFVVLGRATPVVQNDGTRKSVQSQVAILARSHDEAAALDALLVDAGVLLLNIPASRGWNFETCYIAVGDVDITYATDMVTETWATLTLPFSVVDRPAGGSQSQRTFADLLVYPSLGSLMDAYPTFAALLAGP